MACTCPADMMSFSVIHENVEQGYLGYCGPLAKTAKRVLLATQAERKMGSSALKIKRRWKAVLH